MKHRTQVRHLLHAADFGRQQRLLSLVKLLGELYNDLVTRMRAHKDTYSRAHTHTAQTSCLKSSAHYLNCKIAYNLYRTVKSI